MPVVTKYSIAVVDPAVLARPASINSRARLNVAQAQVAVANGDSATSRLFLARVPSSARILSQSTLYHEAITGTTSLHIGLTDGTTTVAAALASALNVATAGTKVLNAAVSTANLNRRVWELLGLTADPGRQIDIFATINVDAAAAGQLVAVIFYATED